MYTRLIFLLALAWIPANGQSSRKVIDREIDLAGETITLSNNTVLSFAGNGMIRNGTIIGDRTSIEANTDSLHAVFSHVDLKGTWAGSIDDRLFTRESIPEDDWQILSNIMKFNDINITRSIYFIHRWRDIRMNGEDVVIHGNGVRLILPSDKGDSRATIWGRRYNTECILSSQTRGYRIEINDLTFVDNEDFINGYGSDTGAEKPVLYYYLAPTQAEIVLNRVNSDGQGSLLCVYNYRQDISKIVLNDCHVRTSQFAIEISNVARDKESGHLDLFEMDNCSIYRYPNAILCGPVSIVGRNHGADSICITRSAFFESNAGNIELSGVDHAVFNDNRCTNLSFYDGDRPPLTYECKGNTFELQRISNPKKSRALSMGGRQIILSDNTYNIKSKPFPFIELLQPWLVERFTVTDNIINYMPESNLKGFSCLFSIKDLKGNFVFTGNQFHTTYEQPEIDCIFPLKPESFMDPSDGKIRISWR